MKNQIQIFQVKIIMKARNNMIFKKKINLKKEFQDLDHKNQ